MEGIPVTVSNAAKREMVRQLSTTGSVTAFADASVVSEVAGVIEDLLVERGQTIKKGDKIAVVEHAEASARLQEARAALQAAQAQLLQAEARLRNVEVEHERIITLFKDGVASQQMLDGYDANREVAIATKAVTVAQVAQAEAAVQQAQVFMENHTIRAPISGVITARYVDEGDKNNPSEPIVSIAQTNPLKVLCDFPECDLPFLHTGQKASLGVDAYPGETFPAEVKIINPSMDPAARTVGVELRAANPNNRLRSGMFARVTVRGDKLEVLAVPDDAVTRMPGTGVEFVFLVDGNRNARRVDVKTGIKADGWTGVSGEIQAGDQVAVEGQNNLKTGSRVRVVTTTVE
jgi:HlyD family secretion protein